MIYPMDNLKEGWAHKTEFHLSQNHAVQSQKQGHFLSLRASSLPPSSQVHGSLISRTANAPMTQTPSIQSSAGAPFQCFLLQQNPSSCLVPQRDSWGISHRVLTREKIKSEKLMKRKRHSRWVCRTPAAHPYRSSLTAPWRLFLLLPLPSPQPSSTLDSK